MDVYLYIYLQYIIYIMTSTKNQQLIQQQQHQPINPHNHNHNNNHNHNHNNNNNHSHDYHQHEHTHHQQQQYQSHPPQPQLSPSPSLPHKQPPIKFGKQSITIKCPFCLQRTRTQIIMKPQLISIMLALLLFTLLPNAVMIVLIVLVLQLTATKRHRCSLCQRQLGTDGKFLIIFTDQVYSCSFGQTGLLISKKIIMTIGLFVLTLALIFIRTHSVSEYDWVQLSWTQLQTRCPYNTISPKCNQELQQKTVRNWKGYIMRVQDRRDSMRRFYEHAVQIYVKMIPPERQSKIPDLYLFGSSSTLYDISDILDSLSTGDQIMFNATFQVNGSRKKGNQVYNRFMEIVGINKTGNRNQTVEVYMSVKEEEYYVKNVEGKALRKEDNV